MSKTTTPLKIIPLGGLGEIGKNIMVVEYGNDMIIIDCGQKFPEDEMLGIDMVLPDFTYILENLEKLRGIILTHGHEDHIGALPYFLKHTIVPVYGTKLTLGLVESKLVEHNIERTDFREIHPDKHINLGCFEINFIRVSHSIPDGVALAINTPEGLIIHTSDFKFDQTPIDGQLTEFEKLTSYRNKVLALLSDSTNAESSGFTLPEKSVSETLKKLIDTAEKRVIVACFASHIHRIQQVIDAAVVSRRRIVVMGRSMLKNIDIAKNLGYLNIPPQAIADISEFKNIKPKNLLILCTGSQGEPLSALTRMASKNHRNVQIVPGDTVIISAKTVPGNEKSVNRVIDLLFKNGAEVYYKSVSEIHVSGHAAQEELKMMINLTNPKYLIPIHGEYRHLKYHAQLARMVGMPEKNIIVTGNGNVIEFRNGKAKLNGKVAAGAVFVDGLGVGDVGNIVLRDRQVLSNDGICIVVATINMQTGQILSGPEIISRGFVYVRESGKLMDEAKQRVSQTLNYDSKGEAADWSMLRNDVRSTLSKFFWEKTKRRPMIMPIIVEL